MIEKEIEALTHELLRSCAGKDTGVIVGAAMYLVKTVAAQSQSASIQSAIAEILRAQARDIEPDRRDLN